ncbi:hypothetical protein CRUP_003117, partial [Coryphaenoides rupestris]
MKENGMDSGKRKSIKTYREIVEEKTSRSRSTTTLQRQSQNLGTTHREPHRNDGSQHREPEENAEIPQVGVLTDPPAEFLEFPPLVPSVDATFSASATTAYKTTTHHLRTTTATRRTTTTTTASTGGAQDDATHNTSRLRQKRLRGRTPKTPSPSPTRREYSGTRADQGDRGASLLVACSTDPRGEDVPCLLLTFRAPTEEEKELASLCYSSILPRGEKGGACLLLLLGRSSTVPKAGEGGACLLLLASSAVLHSLQAGEGGAVSSSSSAPPQSPKQEKEALVSSSSSSAGPPQSPKQEKEVPVSSSSSAPPQSPKQEKEVPVSSSSSAPPQSPKQEKEEPVSSEQTAEAANQRPGADQPTTEGRTSHSGSAMSALIGGRSCIITTTIVTELTQTLVEPVAVDTDTDTADGPIETPMLNLAKRVNHWVWDPNDERKRQERWQQEQERHLQERRILDETVTPLNPSGLTKQPAAAAGAVAVAAAVGPGEESSPPAPPSPQHLGRAPPGELPHAHRSTTTNGDQHKSKLHFFQESSHDSEASKKQEIWKTASLDRNSQLIQSNTVKRSGSDNTVVGKQQPTPSSTAQPPSPTRCVSGKRLCSGCSQPLGKGAAMIIDTMGLFFHLQCFK